MIHSPIEKQFYLAYKLNPESSAYNLTSLFELSGSFNQGIFDKALGVISGRYAWFAEVKPEYHTAFSREEVYTLINTPFDLESGIYFRVHLWAEGEVTFLLFVFHHIIFDLRSKEIFSSEFSEIYNALSEDREPKLKLSISYVKYIDWYDHFSQTEKYRKMLNYWEKETQGNLLLNIPTDKPRKPIPSSSGHRIYGTLPAELTARLERYCTIYNSDPFLVLLTAYSVFLNRYSGQEAFSIGIPRTNRPEGFENTIGCFVNILPICLQVGEKMSFSQLLRQVRLKMLGMHRNQSVPYLEVVKLSEGTRDVKYNPLFQVGFTFEHPMHLDFKDVTSIPINTAPDAAQLDLFFYFWRDESDFRYAVEYCTDLFTQDRVEGFIASFLAILNNALQNDTHPVRTLPLMDGSAQKKIEAWNSTDRAYDYPEGIHQYFLEQVRLNPDRTALVFRDETMTYGQLHQKSASLASYLKDKGVEKESIVGLSLERSFEMVVGMYAIVLAGGTYLPIEPALPEDYISYILEDSKVRIILSKEEFSACFPDTVDFIPLEKFDYSLSSSPVELPPVAPDDRIYILYTSGSTGRPKGVEITHKGLTNRLLWMDEEYKLTSNDILFQKTPYNFDVSGWEFWWPLMKGVPLVIADPDGHKDNRYLIETIETKKITIIHFVPSMLREFLKSCQPGNCTSLRDVICSGESLPAAVVREFYDILPESRLHNLYGPTEASIDVTYWPCQADCSVVPIGRPIANTKIHILDEEQNPLPPGVTGEIYLAGTGLARGYLNKPDLTAQRFVSNPFDGSCMYKTGDLGQWNLTGEILYLGRNDSQVQLHGLRIELGEIENVLNDHPLVDAAAVIVHGAFGAEQSLLAYVEKKDDLTADDITVFLSKQLPLHMVPKWIIFVEELKLNSNGKLDRSSLPQPEAFPVPLTRSVSSPVGEREEQIASLWKDILKLDELGREENFFELGGSSLYVIQVQRELAERWGYKISVTDLFTYTTVKGLAAYLVEGESRSGNKERLTSRAGRSKNVLKRMKNMRIK
jgi:amino acid adenylation domain-containing protein